MAILPPFNTDVPEIETRRTSDRRSRGELREKHNDAEERLSFVDLMAIFAGVACAQLLRLAIIAAGVALVALFIFVGSHL